jgi:hypothetical protein
MYLKLPGDRGRLTTHESCQGGVLHPPCILTVHILILSQNTRATSAKQVRTKATQVLNMANLKISHNFFILILGCQDTLNRLFRGL